MARIEEGDQVVIKVLGREARVHRVKSDPQGIALYGLRFARRERHLRPLVGDDVDCWSEERDIQPLLIL